MKMFCSSSRYCILAKTVYCEKFLFN